MLPGFARQSATVLRPAYKTSHGNKVPDWDAPPASSVTVQGCSIQPSIGAESQEHRDAVFSQFLIWLPAGTDVRARDRVQIAGADYEVVSVQRWETGVLDHVEVGANRWEG